MIFEDEDHFKGRNVTVRLVPIPAPDSSLSKTPDYKNRGFDYRPIESVILSPRYNTFIIHINLNIYILLSAMYCAQDQSLTELEILQ